MATKFTLETKCPMPIDALFKASLSIDTHVKSMGKSQETAIGGVTSGQIGLGETVTWRARHFGVWFTMTSKITALDHPHRFVDEQVSGPFKTFRHEHVFEDTPEGCLMTDTITVASPVLGVIAEQLVLAPYLKRLIRARNSVLLLSTG